MPPKVGGTKTLTIKSKYVEQWPDAPGKVIYAPNSDVMKPHYDYYVFDEAAYKEKFGNVDAGGDCVVTITGITDEISKLADPNLPQPEGGFQKTFHACDFADKPELLPMKLPGPPGVNPKLKELQKELKAQDKKIAELKAKVEAAERAERFKESKALEKKELTESEKEELKAAFDEFDKDKSNYVDLAELKACVEKLGCEMEAEELQNAMKALDVNQDNKISFEEFSAWYTSDAKLGGVTGSKLALLKMKMKMRSMSATAKAMATQAKENMASLTPAQKRGFVFNKSLRTSKAFTPKMTISASLLRSSEDHFKKALQEVSVEETDDEAAAILTVELNIKDESTVEELKGILVKQSMKGENIHYDPKTQVLRIRMVAPEAPIDELLKDAVDSEESIQFEPLAATVLLGTTLEELWADKENKRIHHLAEDYSMTARGAINGPQLAMILTSFISQVNEWDFDEFLLPLLGVSLLRSAQYDGVVTGANTAIERTVVSIVQAITDFIKMLAGERQVEVNESTQSKFFECQDNVKSADDAKKLLPLLSKPEFLQYVTDRMCENRKDYYFEALGMVFTAMSVFQFPGVEQDIVHSYAMLKNGSSGVKSLQLTTKLVAGSVHFTDFNPFVMFPTTMDDVKEARSKMEGGPPSSKPPEDFKVLQEVLAASECPFRPLFHDYS